MKNTQLQLRIIICLAILFIGNCLIASAQTPNEPQLLKLNQPLERQIKGGETQEFQFKLKKGEFARAEVVPTNIDVIVSLLDVNGKTVIEMDGDSSYVWRESVSAIAEKGGNFKVQIKGKEKTDYGTSGYIIRLVEFRKSVALDRKRIEAEKTLVQAIKLVQEKKDSESAKMFETSRNLWHEVGDKHWEAITMWNLAWIYFATDRNDEALELFNQSLIGFQDNKDRIGEAAALNGIGAVYSWIKKYDVAKENLEKALKIRIELKRLRSEYSWLNALIAVYQNLNLSDKIFENFNRMLAIAKELREPNDELNVNYRLGLFYSIQKQNETAINFLNRAAEIAREQKDVESEIKVVLAIGGVYQELSQFDSVRKKYEEAAEIAKKANNKKIESNILHENGKFNVLYLCNLSKGRELLLKALEIKRELKNDKQGEIEIISNLALVSQGLGEFGKLIEYSKLGLDLSKEAKNKSYEIDFLSFLGIGFQNTGKIDEALKYFEPALEISRSEKLILKEVITLQHLSGYNNTLQNYQEAKRLREDALKIAEDSKNNRLISLVLGSLGSVHFNLSEYTEAQTYYERALKIARESNDKRSESSILQSLGLLFEKLGQSDKAITYLEDSLNTEDDQSICNRLYILSSIGSFKSNQNQLEEAIKYYEQALKLAEETNDIYWKSSIFLSMGSLYSKLSQYEKAQKYYEDSLKIAQKANIVPNIGIALLNLGGLYYTLNEYDKSRDYYLQVVKLAKETKNRWLLGFATNGTGSIYTDLSNSQIAKTNIEQSLTLFREVLDRSGEGGILNSLGRIYLLQKDFVNAQKYFEESLAIAGEVKNKQSEVYPLINLGIVYENTNQLKKAQDFYEQGLNLAREVKDRRNEGYALNGLGSVYYKNKKYKEAEDFYRQSLGIAKEVQSKKLEGSVLWNLMELFKELGKPQIAVAYGKQAVNIFQEIRGNIKGFEKESQQSYLRDKETAYRTLADLLIAEDRFFEAQAVLNLLKEEEYSQLNRGETGEIIPYSDIEKSLLEFSAKLAELQQKKEQLPKAVDMNEEQSRQSAGLIKEIEATKKAFDETLKQLAVTEKTVKEQIDNFYKNKTTDSIQNRVSNLQNKTTGVVALYTLVGREETAEKKNARDEKAKFGWVILVAGNVQRAYPIDVKDFNDNVFTLLSALSATERNPQPVAEKIYNAIFRQKSPKTKTTLEQDLQKLLGAYQNKTLMWSLDGVLRYIPMAALHDGESYLAEKYLNTVFTERSISSLLAPNKDDWKILGLGVSEQRENFAALPGVKTELETIVREGDSTAGIISGAIKLNGNFKKELFFNLLSDGDYPVVHIASHYYFNPAQQNDSFLLMGDGRLTFNELNNDTLFNNVDLLTLSACDTGASGNGTEIEGFPYKAQQSGAKSVLASLWKVSDAGTPELMIRFYQLRKDNPQMSKGEAFRQAQLSLLNVEAKSADNVSASRTGVVAVGDKKIELPLFVKDKKKPFAHPHYWASFVLIGNWR